MLQTIEHTVFETMTMLYINSKRFAQRYRIWTPWRIDDCFDML